MLLYDLLNESIISDSKRDFDWAMHIVEKGSWSPGLISMAFNKMKSAGVTRDGLKEYFTPYLPKITEYLAKHWTNGEPHRAEIDAWMLVTTVYELYMYGGMYIRPLVDLIDTLKPILVKSLLTEISYQDYLRARNYTQILQVIGIKWSELDIIERSLIAERDKANALIAARQVGQLNESPPQDVFGKSAKLDPRVARHLNNLDNWLYETSEDPSLEQACFEDGVPYILYKLGLLAEEDLVPERPHIIRPYKNLLMKMLLMAVKDSSQFEESSVGRHQGLESMMRGLRALGANWPELAIVQRSLDHDQTTNPEQLLEIQGPSHDSEDLLAEISYNLDQRDPRFYHANLYPLADYSGVMFKQIDSQGLFDAHKHGTIKALLKSLKDNSEEDIDFMLEVVQGLRKFGVAWPELDVIERSVEHDLNNKRITESEEPFTFSNQEEFLSKLQLYLEASYVETALNTIKDLGENVTTIPEIKKILEANENNIITYLMTVYRYREWSKLCGDIKLLLELGLTWPRLINFFEVRKKVIIKALLQDMKDGIFNRVLNQIKTMQAFGITWHELDIIRNSAEHEKERRDANRLDEHVSQKVKAELLHNLANRESSHMYITILRIAEARMTVKTVPELVDVFDDRKSDIFKKINKSVEMEYYSRVRMILNALLKIGVEWPEVKNYFDDHKTEIIRHVLEIFKDQRLIDTTYCIHQLRTADITWPELDIIERSTDYEREKRNREDDLYESALDNLSIEEQDQLLSSIAKDSGNTNLKNTLAKIVNRKITVRDWPDLDSMLNDYKLEILNNIECMWGIAWYDSAGATIQLLKALGVDWPVLQEFIPAQKISTIRRLLQDIKDGDNYIVVLDEIDCLYRAGCKWDELKVIKRSAEHELGEQQARDAEEMELDQLAPPVDDYDEEDLNESIIEGVSDDDKLKVKIGIEYYVWLGNLKNTFVDVVNWNITVNEWPELLEILDDKKSSILRDMDDMWFSSGNYMLVTTLIKLLKTIGITWEEIENFVEDRKRQTIQQILKDVQYGDFEVARDVIYALYKCKIKWPELEIIERSVAHELERQRLDAIDDPN